MKALGDELNDEFANSQIPKKFNLEEDFDTPDMSVLPTAMRVGNVKSLVQAIFDGSKVGKKRNRYDVLASLMEEVGELATEISIVQGYSGKSKGKDRVTGESIDVILCAVDMIYVDNPDVDLAVLESYIMTIIKNKVEKWKAKQQS